MSNANRIGIQLGRLSPRPWPALKRFPFETWRTEFSLASRIGYNTIEWVFDEERYFENPLWSREGRSEIFALSLRESVLVDSVCADYFLKNPFFRGDNAEREARLSLFKELLEKGSEVGVHVVVLPVIESSELRDDEERTRLVDGIEKCLSILDRHDMKIALETNYSVEEDKGLLALFDEAPIGLVYDLGNHASMGHDCAADVKELGERITNVHVKDRKAQGPSVFLGSGDVDFSATMAALNSFGFGGDYIMEAYFEDDPVGTAEDNYHLVCHALMGGC